MRCSRILSESGASGCVKDLCLLPMTRRELLRVSGEPPFLGNRNESHRANVCRVPSLLGTLKDPVLLNGERSLRSIWKLSCGESTQHSGIARVSLNNRCTTILVTVQDTRILHSKIVIVSRVQVLHSK